jgi:hypothetical protein
MMKVQEVANVGRRRKIVLLLKVDDSMFACCSRCGVVFVSADLKHNFFQTFSIELHDRRSGIVDVLHDPLNVTSTVTILIHS